MKPDEIERASFKLIDEEAGGHHYTEQQWSIVRRIIHTTADFEFKDLVRFHTDAISVGIEAIRNGKMIVADTNMATGSAFGKRNPSNSAVRSNATSMIR